MIWRYMLISKNNGFALYAYSRENPQLDGKIKVDMKTGEASIIKPCKGDEGSPFCIRVACEKAYRLFTESFPENKYLACG